MTKQSTINDILNAQNASGDAQFSRAELNAYPLCYLIEILKKA